MTQRQILADITGTEVHPSKPLYEREQIINSPFWVIGNPDEGYHITMGKYKITLEALPGTCLQDGVIMAIKYLDDHKWDVTLTIALCAITDVTYKDDFKKK